MKVSRWVRPSVLSSKIAKSEQVKTYNDARVQLRTLRFAGFPAWVLWVDVHIYFLIGFANRFFVMLQWVLAFLTKRRQARLSGTRTRCYENSELAVTIGAF